MTCTLPTPYPIPADEPLRLRDLERHAVIGLASDPHFERLVDLAASLFDASMVAISLVDAERQWFLASRGLGGLRETPRRTAFCAHAIAGTGVMVVPDALSDERFRSNPLVQGRPHIRFYAGAPLRSPDGHNLGTLCVLDTTPRPPLDPQRQQQLQWLAELVMRELELRRLALHCPITGLAIRRAFLAIGEREWLRARAEHHSLALLCFDIDDFRRINNRWGHRAGDGVLQDFAKLVGNFKREEDYAGRLGDGEFGLLLINTTENQAMAVAEALRTATTHLPGVHTHSDVTLRISGGLSTLAPADRSFDDLLQRADRALQLAKGNGRDQIACLLEGA
jgi:diguanylate cyclase (GGDEF)-like protein